MKTAEALYCTFTVRLHYLRTEVMCMSAQRTPQTLDSYSLACGTMTSVIYLSGVLQLRQDNVTLANFIMPPAEGVAIETARVWAPERSSLLAFFRMGPKMRRRGCREKDALKGEPFMPVWNKQAWEQDR